jgi:hypothetical protein
MWHFRGTPYYLGQEARRLGITQVLADRARHNPEIYRCSVLLAQLCERYHRARKEDGRPVFSAMELGQIIGTISQAEQEAAKLHALARATAAMIDEACEAFGLEGPDRPFHVRCEYEADTSTFPAGGGTVGVPDGEPAGYIEAN